MSGNALAVVESLDADRVIFLPDQYLGYWVMGQTSPINSRECS